MLYDHQLQEFRESATEPTKPEAASTRLDAVVGLLSLLGLLVMALVLFWAKVPIRWRRGTENWLDDLE